jgi:hypothetical protein
MEKREDCNDTVTVAHVKIDVSESTDFNQI